MGTPVQDAGGLFATLGGKMIHPLVVIFFFEGVRQGGFRRVPKGSELGISSRFS